MIGQRPTSTLAGLLAVIAPVWCCCGPVVEAPASDTRAEHVCCSETAPAPAADHGPTRSTPSGPTAPAMPCHEAPAERCSMSDDWGQSPAKAGVPTIDLWIGTAPDEAPAASINRIAAAAPTRARAWVWTLFDQRCLLTI